MLNGLISLIHQSSAPAFTSPPSEYPTRNSAPTCGMNPKKAGSSPPRCCATGFTSAPWRIDVEPFRFQEMPNKPPSPSCSDFIYYALLFWGGLKRESFPKLVRVSASGFDKAMKKKNPSGERFGRVISGEKVPICACDSNPVSEVNFEGLFTSLPKPRKSGNLAHLNRLLLAVPTSRPHPWSL